MSTENGSPNTQTNQAGPEKANIPPNGPDYGSAPPFAAAPPHDGMPPFPGMPPFAGMPPFGGMPFGSGFSGMPHYGMPPFPMPQYAAPGYGGQGFPGQVFPGQGFPGHGFPGAGYPGMDQMMSQMMDRAAFMHRCMITMSNMAAEVSRACQLLAQNPSQIGMPFSPPAPASAAIPGDKPVDMEALKQALVGMDPVQAQKTLYAVQMMQWFAGMTRPGQPAPPATSAGAPPAEPPAKTW